MSGQGKYAASGVRLSEDHTTLMEVLRFADEGSGGEAPLDEDNSRLLRYGLRGLNKIRRDIKNALEKLANEHTPVQSPLKNPAKSRAASTKKKTSSRAKKASKKAAPRTTSHARSASSAAAGATHAQTSAASTAGRFPFVLFTAACIVVILVLELFFGAFLLAGAVSSRYEKLDANAASIAIYLSSQGLDDFHIAAVLGNLCQESGYSPTALNASSGAFGIAQWLGPRLEGLRLYAAHKGVSINNLAMQEEYLWAEMSGKGPAATFASSQYSHTYFLSLTNLSTATDYFTQAFERCSDAEYQSSKVTRRAEAERVLFSLQGLTAGYSGGGQEYQAATAKQKLVVQAAQKIPSPGANLCLGWVNNVFAYAGMPFTRMEGARDVYWAYCTSSNPKELKVGMIVAVPSTSYSFGRAAGQTYGHVGIYIGDGMVRDNVGTIQTIPMTQWVGCAGDGIVVKWGWAGGVDLSR